MNQTANIETSVIVPIGEYDRLRSLEINRNQNQIESIKQDKKYVYGLAGIMQLFNCSIATANRIKASGKIDKAITQIGRIIITDSDLAMELAKQNNGGRK